MADGEAMAVSDQSKFLRTARCSAADAARGLWPDGTRSIFLLVLVLAISANAKAQLPDAPSASVIAPLKRYSLNVSLDNKYSFTTSIYDLTPRLGVSVRLGEHETVGLSYSHAIDVNKPYTQNNSVLVGMNFRMWSWGKIPQER